MVEIDAGEKAIYEFASTARGDFGFRAYGRRWVWSKNDGCYDRVQEPRAASLGWGMLIAESEEGHYQPVSAVSSMREAEELAHADMAQRIAALDAGAEPMCPSRYVLWAREADDAYAIVREIEAS